MSSSRWNDGLLDEMRRQGDPLADTVISKLSDSGQLSAVWELMVCVTENDVRVPANLPRTVEEYLNVTSPQATADALRIEEGEELFERHGPEILLILACYSLPMAYAAHNGVQVLWKTKALRESPTRRLFETAQMVVDVMRERGLAAGEVGVRSAQAVRLMHAKIRHEIRHDEDHPWDEEKLGVPINQEDLAGTLMSFSSIVLDGLKKLGIDIDPAIQEAYLAAWRAVGGLLGIQESLLPGDMNEARELTRIICSRQHGASDEGRRMTAPLLHALERNTPLGFGGFPAAYMRWFLPGQVADWLHVPNYKLESLALTVFIPATRVLDRVTGSSEIRELLFRRVGVQLIQWMLNVELRGPTRKFRMPEKLEQKWRVRREPSFLQLLRDRYF